MFSAFVRRRRPHREWASCMGKAYGVGAGGCRGSGEKEAGVEAGLPLLAELLSVAFRPEAGRVLHPLADVLLSVHHAAPGMLRKAYPLRKRPLDLAARLFGERQGDEVFDLLLG